MSSSTWTPPAVASESVHVELPLWRAVEAQHVVATRALVDNRQEQELLEALLEADKPPRPPGAAGLDYLLFTPFRYAPAALGSRFRAFTDPGVWYGAELIRTACAEVGYWRWRFLLASAGLKRLDAVPHTIFQARASGRSVDLRAPPFQRDQQRWGDPVDYSACQAFAQVARQAQIQLIRYRSVRDPRHAGAAAVLELSAFRGSGGVRRRQSWFLTVDRGRASWLRAGSHPGQVQAHEFMFDAHALSPPAAVPPADPGPA
ncbi:MAG TPA: RES family NAD+ phosphorylase [Steroidobacteraceae bacterium]|nr:RES family NAD+ phosphorylase [Steroidobacteraceae bacterium]